MHSSNFTSSELVQTYSIQRKMGNSTFHPTLVEVDKSTIHPIHPILVKIGYIHIHNSSNL